MKPRFIAIFALVAALAVAAPAIAATFNTGDYKGKTKQKRKFKLHADAVQGEVTIKKFVETGACNDGGSSKGTQGPFTGVPVKDSGNFKWSGTSKKGTHVHLVGTLSGNKAHGNFKVTSRFNKHTFKPDRHGAIRCSTGKVKWTAKRTG